MLTTSIKSGWRPLIDKFESSAEGKKLDKFLAEQKARGVPIFPATPFRALELVRPEDVKVVILGQDPYHGKGQATGLAFGVSKEVAIPRSLKNIFKEISAEFPGATFSTGELEGWAEQGVLLLNAVLTVVEGKPNSHGKKGWEELTDSIIQEVAESGRPVVFMLWGNSAKAKKQLIESLTKNALILESNHPSPLAATKGPTPFIGNGHFKKANDWLQKKGLTPINWAANTQKKP